MSKTENKRRNYSGDTSDFPVIDRTLAGEQLAFEELFQKHRVRIFRFFMRSTKGNIADSEDFVQDTFVLAFSKLHTFNKESAFYTWLYKIAVNVFLMSCRRKNYLSVPIDKLQAGQTMDGELTVEKSDDQRVWSDKRSEIGALDQALENVLNKILVDQLMRNLPSGYKKILELHDLQELNYKAAAAKIQRKVGTAKSQRHKAIGKIRYVQQFKPRVRKIL